MKLLLRSAGLLLILAVLASCKNKEAGTPAVTEAPKAEKEMSAATGTEYTVDVSQSEILWTGSKPTGSTHNGKIKLNEGTVLVNDGSVTGGKFSLDMNSIENVDLSPDDGKAKLEGHLKSDDFFGVEQYPTGTFVITNVSAVSGNPAATHKITGNLTLRDKTNSITFDANIITTDTKLVVTSPAFTINRTQWDVNFNSTVLNTVKDKLINDDISLILNITATK